MKRLLTFILTMLMLIMPVHAQDAQPTLSANDLFDWSYTLHFPQQIDFTLFGRLAESDISEFSLTIDYDNIDPITIPMDLEIAVPTSGGTRYDYTWTIPEDTPPPLFSTVRYRWSITTESGRQVNALDNFIFEDTRVTWERDDDTESRVDIYYARNQVDPDDIRSGIRKTYDLLFANISNKPTYKLLIYPESIPIGCDRNEDDEPIIDIRNREEPEVIDCNLSLANQLYDDAGFIVFQQSGVASIQQALIEQLVATYYTDIWGDTDVPAWFLRGLQRFYDPRPDIEALAIAKQRFRSGDLLTLDELTTVPEDQATYAIWDAQSTGLVLYIADTIGVDALFEFANSLGDESFVDAYEDATGNNLDVLLLSWQDWLFRSSTADDYEFDPYLPDTATPTITPTATNTPTATFTPSITPDVTITPRPTITPIPPTATITPLPAQSFSVQPTAIPPTPTIEEIEQPSFTVDEDSLPRFAIGGGVILLLLIVLFFVLRKR